MTSVWEFIKRNRGKLLFGGVLVGGAAYAIHNVLQTIQQQEALAQYSLNDPQRIQARRYYVFETNQRTCDKSIMELAKHIGKRIALSLDVETSIAKLRQDGAQLSESEKILIWNKMKIMVVSRIMAAAYSFSLLTVAMKCQISILSSYICASFDHVDDHSSWWSKYMSNYFGVSSSDTTAPSTVHTNAQRLFLNCIQYFATNGIDELLVRTQKICEEELDEISLKTEITLERLKNLIETIKRRMSSIDTRHFSYLIVPKFANQDAFALPHSGDLQALLNRLVEILESSKCKMAASNLIDYYVNSTLHWSRQHGKSNGLVLARLVPILADCYPILTSCGIDSPLQNSLCSPDLHQLTMYAFSLPPPTSMSNLSVQ